MNKTCTICNKKLSGNQQKFCSGKCKQKSHWDSFKHKPNSYHNQTIRAIKRKIKCIEILGGKCSKCGYNKNIAALEFNHIDPNTKCFNICGRILSNTRESKILSELEKCNLLCANCHRELHYPESNLDNIKKILFDNL